MGAEGSGDDYGFEGYEVLRNRSGSVMGGRKNRSRSFDSPPPGSHPSDKGLSPGTPEKTAGAPFAQDDTFQF
jgi:hypothetical protein